MLTVVCSNCDKKFQVRDELAGRTGKCPGCGRLLTVPAARAVTARPAPVARKPAPPPDDEDDEQAVSPVRSARRRVPADSDPEEDEREPRRGGKRSNTPVLLVAGIAAGLLLGLGGAVGAYFLFLRPAPDANRAPAPVTPAAAQAVTTPESSPQQTPAAPASATPADPAAAAPSQAGTPPAQAPATNPVQERLLGRWQGTDLAYVYEFKPDGTYSVSYPGRGVMGSGLKFTVIDEFTLEMEMKNGQMHRMQMKLTADQLELTSTVAPTDVKVSGTLKDQVKVPESMTFTLHFKRLTGQAEPDAATPASRRGRRGARPPMASPRPRPRPRPPG